jgi:phosphogluconate dehydratase
VPAAIHVSPEVLAGGPLGRVRNGDMIRLDAEAGILQALVPESEWAARTIADADLSSSHVGMGRELFAMFRKSVSTAEEGATTYDLPPPLAPAEAAVNVDHVREAEPFNDEDNLIRQPI